MAVVLSALASGSLMAQHQFPASSLEAPVYGDTTKGAVVKLTTNLGDIRIQLFDDTPKHRDNFLKLVENGTYDGVLFHRVIRDFMVQTGDIKSKDSKPGDMLGDGDVDYTIEAEFRYPQHFHHAGAVAAARTSDSMNPERRSSGAQFYIVTGKKFHPQQIEQTEARRRYEGLKKKFDELTIQNKEQVRAAQMAKDTATLENLRQKFIAEAEATVKFEPMPQEVKDAYVRYGGAPHLDGAYTVFGQVLSGIDVVDKIQQAETSKADRPKEDIRVIKAVVERR